MTSTSRRMLACLLLGATLLTGCSAAGQSTSGVSSTTRPVASRPADARTLAELGFVNGPANFWMPTGTTPTSRIDQPNVITLFLTAEQGEQTASWLRTALPTMGWAIEADRNGSLLFRTDGWRGAFTTPTAGEKATQAALTLRQEKS